MTFAWVQLSEANQRFLLRIMELQVMQVIPFEVACTLLIKLNAHITVDLEGGKLAFSFTPDTMSRIKEMIDALQDPH